MSRRIRNGIAIAVFVAMFVPATAQSAPARREQGSWLSEWVPRIVLKIQRVIREIKGTDDLNLPPGNPTP